MKQAEVIIGAYYTCRVSGRLNIVQVVSKHVEIDGFSGRRKVRFAIRRLRTTPFLSATDGILPKRRSSNALEPVSSLIVESSQILKDSLGIEPTED